MELLSSVFYVVLFVAVMVFVSIVPFMAITFFFKKDKDDAEPWMYVASGVIVLILFFIAYGDNINWHKF